MGSAMRGGGVARRALLLALCPMIGLMAVGCRKSAPAGVVRHFVRLDALLPLHPLWPQVVALERAPTGLPPAPPVPNWNNLPLPKPFPAPSVPPRLVESRRRPLEAYMRRYLAERADRVRLRIAEITAREERAARKLMEQQLMTERERRLTALQAQQALALYGLDKRLRALGFREAALLSQVRVYHGQTQLDAQIQRAQVRKNVDQLTAERDKAAADVRPEVAQQMEPIRKQAEAALLGRMQARRNELEQAAQTRLAAAQARLEREVTGLDNEAEAIPPLGGAPSPAAAVPSPVFAKLSAPDLTASFLQAQAAIRTTRADQRAAWNAERTRLIALIRDDTLQSVEQIARRQGWSLVGASSPGATDATAQAADALRLQWGHTSNQTF